LNFIGTQEPDIEFEPILRESFVAACHRDHPLARKRKITWSELNEAEYMTDIPARPRWFYEVRHVSTLVGLVEAGLGVAAVPRLAMPQGDHATLVSIPLVEPTITRTVGLIRRRSRSLSPAAQQLYDLLLASRPRHKGTVLRARS